MPHFSVKRVLFATPGGYIFFCTWLSKRAKNRKNTFKMRFFHPDPHQKSAKRVLRVFLAKKKFYPLNFFSYIFFLDQLFFRKIVMTLTLKRKISQKNLTLNAEDVREKPTPKLYEKNLP